MQFYDEVKIQIQSGKGGDGAASGRREAGVPFGGPNGGDGGNGGSVYIQASKDENTLLTYKYKKIFKAKAGENGRTKDQYGADGPSITLTVPVGTIVKDAQSKRILYQLEQDGERIELLSGGEGGKGNIHFKDAINQYPNFYLLGEPGQKREIILELQLLADIGLIGSPSVGKTSLINCMSDVKAKVADYPFTTLVPNLGSVSVGDFRFNVIDIPGLIEGSAEGKGLGNAFLRHVLKARIFAFVSDLANFENGIDETVNLFHEIMSYIRERFEEKNPLQFHLSADQGFITLEVIKDDVTILKKRILRIFNKRDLFNDTELLREYKNSFLQQLNQFLAQEKLMTLSMEIFEKNTFTTSAGTYFGVGEMMRSFAEVLQKTDFPSYNRNFQLESVISEGEEELSEGFADDITDSEKEKLINENYINPLESRFAKVRHLQHPEISKMVFMTPRGNDEAEHHFWQIMKSKGFLEFFEAQGILKGDILKIKSYYGAYEDKYLLY